MSEVSRSVVKGAGGASVVTLVGGGLVVGGGGVAEAQTFTASNEAELIQAIQNANAAGGADTITISGATIALSASLPVITDELTITGAGQGSTIVDGFDSHSVFYAADATSLTVEQMTIQDAYNADYGSAIIAKGTDLTISYVTFDQNEAEFGGGAVFFETTKDSAALASLSISNSTFTGNLSGEAGGAVLIYNTVTVVDADITSSTFTSNSANTYGGAVRAKTYGPVPGATTDLTISDSTFSENSGVDGGAVEMYSRPAPQSPSQQFAAPATISLASSKLTVTDSSFTGNLAGDADGGGAIWAKNYLGSAAITGSTFTSNSAGYDGGAVYVGYMDATVSDSEFSDNYSGRVGGAIVGYEMKSLTVTNSTFDGNTSYSSGGAIYFNDFESPESTFEVSNSTFVGNESVNGDGGAIQADGPSVVIDQSTFTGNSAAGSGGALYLFGGATIRNATISGNSANTVGGVAMGFAYSLTIVNTVVSGNTETTDEGTADLRISDSVENGPPGTELLEPSIDYSIVGVSSGDVTSAGSGNIIATDPMLGALSDNGGDTETMVPLTGSPAIDAGDSAVHTFDTDQRGESRVQGVIDIGAVEVSQEPMPTTTSTTSTVPSILPPTGSDSRTGVLAALLTGFGAALTFGASRRRRPG